MKIYIIDAKRTAIGKFLGSFYEQDPYEVCVQLGKKLFSEASINPLDVELSIFGNVISAGHGQGLARKIALGCGIGEESPAYSVNMVCGSGMQALTNGVNEIRLGKKLIFVGGYEFMSNIPFITNTYIRMGKKYGSFEMVDLMINDGLTDNMLKIHMGMTAENIAKEFNISRDEQDNFAYICHQRALESLKNDYFKDEIVPIKLFDYKHNEFIFERDEFPNPFSTLEKLKSLKPSFLKDGTGTVTAGNSSGINDGASFLLLANEDYCKSHGIMTNIEIVDCISVGLSPYKMGLGPFYAIKKLLSKNNLYFEDIDLFEINEAFAAQILGCFKMFEKEYGVDMDYLLKHVNIHGSGLGLGHPLGCTGARIVTTLFHSMKKSLCKYGVASTCIGGGMGIAILLRKE